MTRVCFIGDSHLATLKFGMPFVKDDCPGMTPVFFAGPGKSMRALALSGNALVATDEVLRKPMGHTSGGLDAIRDEHDCYLLHGMELSIAIALHMVRAQRSDPTLPQWPLRGKDDAFQKALAAAMRETIAVKVLTMLRQITSAPIFLSPTPLSHAQLPALRKRLAKRRENEALVQLFETVCGQIAESVDARFLPQPAITREADGIATQQIYSQQPSRFSIKEPAEDRSHMGAEYGAAVLRDFLAAASLSPR